MVKTSSIGMRSGLSTSRSGVGMASSTACIRPRSFSLHSLPLLAALQRLQRGDADDREVVTRELVLGEQHADPELDELQDLLAAAEHLGRAGRS